MPVAVAAEQIATREDILQELQQEVPEVGQQELEKFISAASVIESALAVSPDTIQMANKVYQDVKNDAKQAQRMPLKVATLIAARTARQIVLRLGH